MTISYRLNMLDKMSKKRYNKSILRCELAFTKVYFFLTPMFFKGERLYLYEKSAFRCY